MESGDSSEDYQPGKYVACMYDAEWYVGSIKDRSEEHSDVLVLFMKKKQEMICFHGLQDHRKMNAGFLSSIFFV